MHFFSFLFAFFSEYLYLYTENRPIEPAADQPSPLINYFNYYNNHKNNNLLMYVNQNRFV